MIVQLVLVTSFHQGEIHGLQSVVSSSKQWDNKKPIEVILETALLGKQTMPSQSPTFARRRDLPTLN